MSRTSEPGAHRCGRRRTHRVKNGLAIVASMLKLQASEVNDPALTLHLEESAYRVSAVAKAHERIHQGNGPDRLELGAYVRDVCRDLNEAVHRAASIEADDVERILPNIDAHRGNGRD